MGVFTVSTWLAYGKEGTLEEVSSYFPFLRFSILRRIQGGLPSLDSSVIVYMSRQEIEWRPVVYLQACA